mgnify:CR=1 FL=1
MELAQHARDVIPHLKQIDKGYPLFWYNSDKVKGFRLTQRGFDTMIDIGYVSYTFRIYKLTTNNIIKMDQKIFHPWFLLGLSTFRIFGFCCYEILEFLFSILKETNTFE